MKTARKTRIAAMVFTGLFAGSLIGAGSDYSGFGASSVWSFSLVGKAEAKGRKGGARRHGHGGHHGGHHGGGNRPQHRPGGHHRPNHKPGHGNNHHHHNNDKWHNHYKHHGYYDHYGRWIAGGIAAGATAAAIGSMYYSLPRGCREFISGGVRYWDCGGVYYTARYQGSNVRYVVVNRP